MKSSSAAHDELLRLVSELGEDERLVLTALARRLRLGQQRYGRLDLAHDRRDWRNERGAELEDMLVYTAIEEVRRKLLAPLSSEIGSARLAELEAAHDKSNSTRDTIPDIELGKAEPTHSDICPICRKRI